MTVNRLVCIVEGKGDRKALPNLCSRIRNELKAWTWFVDPEPVRWDRGKLVDCSFASPNRPAAVAGLTKALTLAMGRPAAAVLVTCDQDDDCAAVWGPSADAVIRSVTSGAATMIVREYETWLLHSVPRATRAKAGIGTPEDIRDAKGMMRLFVNGYKPTIHQLSETQNMDLRRVWAASDSFDKLVRTLAAIFGVAAPARPRLR